MHMLLYKYETKLKDCHATCTLGTPNEEDESTYWNRKVAYSLASSSRKYKSITTSTESPQVHYDTLTNNIYKKTYHLKWKELHTMKVFL
jgi:hypothetical protein